MSILYLDVDGVFADFDKKMKEVGAHPWDPKNWPILEKVDRLFWHMEPMPDSMYLWESVKHLRPVFLTARPLPTGKLVTATADKVQWIRHHFSRNAPVIVSDGWKDKVSYLSPGDILVDDMQRNIDAWNAAGGIGIRHTSASNTVAKLVVMGVL